MTKKLPLRRAVRSFRRFSKSFGAAGIPMAFKFLPLELELGGFGTAALTLPGSRSPIYLRKGTTDKDVFFQVFLIREYDFSGIPQFDRLKAVYDDMLAHGETPLIVDGGANIGLSCLWFARLFPEARIYALEPDEGNYAMLCANTRDYPNIVPLRAALWDRGDAKVLIANQKDPASCYRVMETGGAGGGFAACTVPDIMRRAGAARILLAKIDIEGGEDALFRSNTAWLDKTEALAVELHDWMLPGLASSRNFLVALANHPFEVVWHHGTMFCVKLPEQRPAQKSSRAIS
jgi:FkbM family methyltransferase